MLATKTPAAEITSPELVAGRYELKKRLARGGMGEVFSALDKSSGARVALKRMLATAASDSTTRMHFMREYHALSALRHPRIIEVYDYGLDRGRPYYTMELLDGRDARDLAPLPYREACRYLHDVASSLALLHARRLLHRDVSPRNVRCISDDHCKLIDFGTMMPFGQPKDVAGTPPCVPPEALQGGPLDQRSDLYALGAVGYWLLTGTHARDVRRFEELVDAWQKPLLRPRRRVADIPERLDELIVALLALDRSKRPTHAADVAEALASIAGLSSDDTPDVARSFFSSADLVGRAPLLQALDHKLAATLEARGDTLLLAGETGSGKSRALHEASVSAQTKGFLVVRAQARHQHGAHTLARELVQALRTVAPEQAQAALERAPTLLGWLEGSRDTKRFAPVTDGPNEVRARLQEDLTRLFCEVAGQRPLLIAVDDVDRADELSLSLLSALSASARATQLLLLVTRTSDGPVRAPGALETLEKMSIVSVLPALAREQSDHLVRGIFAAAPNIDRVSDWLFRAARGNPGVTLSLAQHLHERGVVKYSNGAWVLPSKEIAEAAPATLVQALATRLAPLSATARDLACLIGVRRGSASVALCLSASQLDAAAAFAALDELVREGILEGVGDEYVFVQEAMRQAVLGELSQAQEQGMHARLGHALLRLSQDEGQASQDVRLEAGWHLVHTREELRGADILAQVGPPMVRDGLSLATALPAIEKALEVYDRHARPLSQRLFLRTILLRASYTFDYRLLHRHGEQTLQLLFSHSGLALAERLSPHLGRLAAGVLALCLTEVRRWFRPSSQRGPFVMTALVYFARTAVSMMGVYATALDGPNANRVFKLMQNFGAIAGLVRARAPFDACRVFALQPLGREADMQKATHIALRGMRDSSALMSAEERRDLTIGLLLVDAINECYKLGSQALVRAATLESMGSSLAVAAAHRVRMVYYLVRGNRERTEHYRKLIDLHGLQGGTTWQVEWFSVPIEGLAGAYNADMLLARRALLRLEDMIKEVPSLTPLRDLVRIAFHARSGEHERAAALGEAFFARHAMRSVIGWGPGLGMVALTLLELGHYDRARALCESALAQLTEDDLKYFVMYAALEGVYASSLMLLGDRTEGERRFEALSLRLTANNEHAGAVLLHEMRSRVYKHMGDRQRYLHTLDELRAAAVASEQPSVVMFADVIASARTRFTYDSSPPIMPTQKGKSERPAPEQTAVTHLLINCADDAERTQKALRLIAQATDASEGYLFAFEGQDSRLIATLQDRPPPKALAARVAALGREKQARSAGMLRLQDDDRAGGQQLVVFLKEAGAGSLPVGAAVLKTELQVRPTLPTGILEDVARMLAQQNSQRDTLRPKHRR